MARGWESKSVEAQMEESKAAPAQNRQPTPTPEERKGERKRAELHLSRKCVAQQLTASTNERYSAMLRQALADLDRQLEGFGG